MLLEGKNAVVYGGGGTLGGGVARAFAKEGARVFLAGRTPAKVEAVAEEIRSGGGRAEAAEVDALDAERVEAYVRSIAADAGSLDVSFNLISVDDVQGTPLVEMDYAEFARPIEIAMRSTFLTATAAARQMIRQGSGGAILALGGLDGPVRDYNIGGFQVALQVVEAMRRQLSSELGRDGVRFVTLKTGGFPETVPTDFPGQEELAGSLVEATLLKRAASFEDLGDVAAFVASDKARTMTAATVNISAGALIDL
jgi:NAD(P)-dependent dehydrogenase (short-subunit alcohol dehydrogenase family)